MRYSIHRAQLEIDPGEHQQGIDTRQNPLTPFQSS
jgi:hypothetical protein